MPFILKANLLSRSINSNFEKISSYGKIDTIISPDEIIGKARIS